MDEQTEEKFITKKSFSTMIESFVFRNKQSYMDAIVHLCEENGLELEDVKKYLSLTIVEHLESEARQLNFLPKQNTLDV
jgi:hypothetical protein